MDTIDIWTSSVVSAMDALWREVAGFLPNLAAAVIILLIGYIIARIVRGVAARLLSISGVNQLSATSGIGSVLSRTGFDRELSDIMAQVVFWIIMLLSFVSASETLGLVRMAAVIDSFIMYLPNVLGAILILLGGLYIAGFARDVVAGTADGIGIDYSAALGTVVYALIAVIVLALAVGQLNLETELLGYAISIVLLSTGVATAIAFGFGARHVAANVIAGTYLKDLYRDDDVIEIGDVSGRLIGIGAVKTIVATEDGDVSIANSLLIEMNIKKRNDATP